MFWLYLLFLKVYYYSCSYTFCKYLIHRLAPFTFLPCQDKLFGYLVTLIQYKIYVYVFILNGNQCIWNIMGRFMIKSSFFFPMLATMLSKLLAHYFDIITIIYKSKKINTYKKINNFYIINITPINSKTTFLSDR